MQNKKVGRSIVSYVGSTLLVAALLSAAGTALADKRDGKFYSPERAGAYGIGHTTVTLTDPSRNLDGSAPATAAGRFLHLDIWYPTMVKTEEHIRYTWNNPLYNENPGGAVYPGLPDLPALTAEGALSWNPVTEKAPLAHARFPLLVATHGNLVSSAKNMPDTLETLASHGYIVASVEHTGNDDAYYQASAFGWIGAAIGPNPRLGPADLIAQRSKDVRFVIDAVLAGALDSQPKMPFSERIQADKIGVLGYSLGGQTSLATVTGIGSAAMAPDPRIKAALMSGGSNYGLLLDAADYANAKVPLLFLGNDMGIAYNYFNQFTGSPKKYLADIAGVAHHTAGYQSSWCQDFHNSMVEINARGATPWYAQSPTDYANFVFDATFYFTYTGSRQSGVYEYCDGSVFDGITDGQLESAFFGPSDIVAVKNELQPLMPLKPEVSLAEITRMTNLYAVAFFNQSLKGDQRYAPYLKDSGANRRTNPLVDFTSDCRREKDHPIDLRPGDKITFAPQGNDGYNVSVKSGQSLYDKGETKLNSSGDASVYLNYDGFSFFAPGLADPISTLIVNEDGAITARTASGIGGIDDNGSPWYTRGQLLLSNRFTIGALMKNLDSGPYAATDRGVYGYFDSDNARVVVTYWNVRSAGTTEPNTLQVAIYSSGKIEIIIGELAATGANFSPDILGTIGLATGQTKARDLREVNPINFSRLRDRAPVYMRLDGKHAIYEQFYGGARGSCRNADADEHRGHDDDDHGKS